MILAIFERSRIDDKSYRPRMKILLCGIDKGPTRLNYSATWTPHDFRFARNYTLTPARYNTINGCAALLIDFDHWAQKYSFLNFGTIFPKVLLINRKNSLMTSRPKMGLSRKNGAKIALFDPSSEDFLFSTFFPSEIK